MSELLSVVDAFLKKNRMSATAFGREVLGDPSFIPDLKKGRRVWPETEEKVRTFIRSQEYEE